MKTVLLVLLLLAFGVNAQERKDKINLKFDTKSEKVTKAQGWSYDKNGKWIQNNNFIWSVNSNIRPKYAQTLNYLQLNTIVINNKKHYALVFESDIRAFGTDTNYMILTSKQYADFKSKVCELSNDNITLKTKWHGEIDMRYSDSGTDTDILGHITQTVENGPDIFPYWIFTLTSQSLEEMDVVRFRLPSSYSNPPDKEYFEMPLIEFEKLFID